MAFVRKVVFSGRKRLIFRVKWGYFALKMRDFRVQGGTFGKKMCDFREKRGSSGEKTRDFGVNGAISLAKT